MAYDRFRHHRRSIRLREWDYAHPGAYFVTICTYRRECTLADIVDGDVRLRTAGEIVRRCWHDLPARYSHVDLDAFVIMPNHIHGIIVITETPPNVGAGLRPAPTGDSTPIRRHGLPEIVRALKSFSARRINEHRGTPGAPVWQRNYHERIVRHDRELTAIRDYIAANPYCWEDDPENRP